MGHSYTTIQGTGRTEQEAIRDAIDQFLYEEGNRHDVRGTDKHRLLTKVPPLKTVEERQGTYIIVRQVENPSAPPEQWLEVWECELHTHA